MKVLLPMAMYRVRYEIATGRPYSEIDRLVLEAVVAGLESIEDLRAEFCVHNARVLVETLVTLARAGWVAIDATGGGFRATDAGCNASSSAVTPPFTLIEGREASVFLDRLTGSVASQREMKPYWTHPEAENSPLWSSRLKPALYNERIDPARVRESLPCPRDWRVRWVDNPVAVKNSLWLPVDCDVANAVFVNLPDRWQRSVGLKLLEQFDADGSTQRLGEEIRPEFATELGSATYTEGAGAALLLTTNAQHAEALTAAVDRAANMLCIASAFLRPRSLAPSLRAGIVAALRRGVHVMILWGYERDEAAKEALAWLRAVRNEAGEAGVRMRFNTEASGSHAKLLIYDEAELGFFVLTGSCNWLSARLEGLGSDLPLSNTTIRLQSPRLVATFLHNFHSLWLMSERGQWSDAPRMLESVAEKIITESTSQPIQAADESADSISVRIIRDQEHESEMRNQFFRVQQRCLVVSHRLGPVGYPRLASLLRERCNRSIDLRVVFTDSFVTPIEQVAINELVDSLGGRMLSAPNCHSKLLVGDDSVIISSYNFLSADPFGHAGDTKEIGVVVSDKQLADSLWSLSDEYTTASPTEWESVRLHHGEY